MPSSLLQVLSHPASSLKPDLNQPVRPKSSILGNPHRKINYESRMFTTDIVTVDKKLDDVEEMILKFNKRPRTTDKKIRIDIDLKDKREQHG